MSVPLLLFPGEATQGNVPPYPRVNATTPAQEYLLKHPLVHLMLYLRVINDVTDDIHGIFSKALTTKRDPIIDTWRLGMYAHSTVRNKQQIVLTAPTGKSYETAVNGAGLITLPVYLIVHSEIPRPKNQTEMIIGPLITGHVAKYVHQYSYDVDEDASHWDTWKRSE